MYYIMLKAKCQPLKQKKFCFPLEKFCFWVYYIYKGGDNDGTQGDIFKKFKKIYGIGREKP